MRSSEHMCGEQREETQKDKPATPAISLFGRRVPMPRSRMLRIVLGVAFIVLGLFGFLPVLGFWMVPIGLLVLSYDFALIRRMRRKSVLWWHKRRDRR